VQGRTPAKGGADDELASSQLHCEDRAVEELEEALAASPSIGTRDSEIEMKVSDILEQIGNELMDEVPKQHMSLDFYKKLMSWSGRLAACVIETRILESVAEKK
jgi:hypothetical protein